MNKSTYPTIKELITYQELAKKYGINGYSVAVDRNNLENQFRNALPSKKTNRGKI